MWVGQPRSWGPQDLQAQLTVVVRVDAGREIVPTAFMVTDWKVLLGIQQA